MSILSDSQIRDFVKILAEKPQISAAFLMGSAVRGELRADSDIDVAVLFKPESGLSFSQKVELSTELSKICRRDVDIGELDTRNLVYAREAYLTGKCVYCSNTFQRDMFGATALGLYAELKDSRKEVENAYRY